MPGNARRSPGSLLAFPISVVLRVASVVLALLFFGSPARAERGAAQVRKAPTSAAAASKARHRPANARLARPGQSGQRFARLPRRELPVPHIRQTTDYTCGPASLLAVLRYFGKAPHAGEMSLAAEVGTTSADGSEPSAMARVARRHGLAAELRTGVTLGELARQTRLGRPVIVLFQAWSDAPSSADYARTFDNGHFAVVIGVDRHNVYLQDPWIKGARGVVSRAEFARRWHGMEGSERLHRPAIVVTAGTAAATARQVLPRARAVE